MANVLIDGLTGAAVGSTLVGTDILEIEHDPAGTPASLKATVNQLTLVANVPCCSVTRTTNQAITDSVVTAIAFDVADTFDTDTMHNPASNNTRLTFTTAGVYACTACVSFAGNATGIRSVRFKLNGTTTLDNELITPGNATASVLTVTQVLKCAAADYVEVIVFQNSTGSLNVDRASAQAFRVAVG